VRSVRRTPGRDGEEGEDLVALLPSDFLQPGEQADEKELTQLVDSLLPQIPEDQRLAFILYSFAGLSLPEIAEAMESNLPTTKSRLRLAREKLREKLAAKGILDPNIAS